MRFDAPHISQRRARAADEGLDDVQTHFGDDMQRVRLQQLADALDGASQCVLDGRDYVIGQLFRDRRKQRFKRRARHKLYLSAEQCDRRLFAERAALALKRDAQFRPCRAHHATSRARRAADITRACTMRDSRMMRRKIFATARSSSGPALTWQALASTARSRAGSHKGSPAADFNSAICADARARRFNKRSNSRSISSISARQLPMFITSSTPLASLVARRATFVSVGE